YNFAADSTPVLVIENSVIENNTGSPAISSHIADVSVRASAFINNPAGNIEGGYTNLGGNSPANPWPLPRSAPARPGPARAEPSARAPRRRAHERSSEGS